MGPKDLLKKAYKVGKGLSLPSALYFHGTDIYAAQKVLRNKPLSEQDIEDAGNVTAIVSGAKALLAKRHADRTKAYAEKHYGTIEKAGETRRRRKAMGSNYRG